MEQCLHLSLILYLLRYVLKKADYVIFQSNFCKNSSEKWLCKLENVKKNLVLFNPVNINKFNKANIKKTHFNLLIIGTHQSKERVLIALKVLKELIKLNTSFFLNIAGDFQCKNANKELKSFLTLLPKDQPSQTYIERCHEFLTFPPKKNWDGVFVAQSK